jgi:hypothetical protein
MYWVELFKEPSSIPPKSKILVNPTKIRKTSDLIKPKDQGKKKVAMNLGFLRRGKWKIN